MCLFLINYSRRHVYHLNSYNFYRCLVRVSASATLANATQHCFSNQSTNRSLPLMLLLKESVNCSYFKIPSKAYWRAEECDVLICKCLNHVLIYRGRLNLHVNVSSFFPPNILQYVMNAHCVNTLELYTDMLYIMIYSADCWLLFCWYL